MNTKPKICDASQLFGLNVALEEQEQLDYVKVKDLVDTKAEFSIERITYKSDVPSDYAETGFCDKVYLTVNVESLGRRFTVVTQKALVDVLHQMQICADKGNSMVLSPTTRYMIDTVKNAAGTRQYYKLKVVAYE